MKKKKKVISRSDAIKEGKSVYYTGKNCRNGHNDLRYVSNGTCLECLRIARLEERKLIKQIRTQAAA